MRGKKHLWSYVSPMFKSCLESVFSRLCGHQCCQWPADTCCLLVSQYLKPNQPQRIISEQKTIFNLSPSYSARKSSKCNFFLIYKSVLTQIYIKQNIHTQTYLLGMEATRWQWQAQGSRIHWCWVFWHSWTCVQGRVQQLLDPLLQDIPDLVYGVQIWVKRGPVHCLDAVVVELVS